MRINDGFNARSFTHEAWALKLLDSMAFVGDSSEVVRDAQEAQLIKYPRMRCNDEGAGQAVFF